MTENGDARFDDIMPILSPEWPVLPFEECLVPISAPQRKLKGHEIQSAGLIPVIDQGEAFICGYTNDEHNQYPGPLPTIIFGDHTRRFKFVPFRFAVGAEGVRPLHPIEQLDPKFFYYYLSALRIEGQGYSRHYRFLKEASVPIPPLPEQRRIVGQVEALLAKVKSSQERLDKIPTILKRFRQAVLAAACSGKLTADWRKEHPGIAAVRLDFCERWRREKVNRANAKAGRSRFRYAPPALIDIGDRTKGIDELFELPETWAWASLGQLTWAVADGPHFSPKYVAPEDGVAFISGRHISYEGIDFSDAKYVSREDHAQFTKRTQPEVGDVLLTKGGTTGIATVVTTDREFSVWVHVAVLKVVDELVDRFYLRDALSAPLAYIQSQAQTHGVGNQDLGLTRMVHIALPVPPIAEQREIVKRVQAAFKVADRLEARYTKAKVQVDPLTQSILAKAFRGELVPTEAELARREGREYETAEELLARIQRNAAVSGKGASARRPRALVQR